MRTRRSGPTKFAARQTVIDHLIEIASRLPREAQSTVRYMRYLVKTGRSIGIPADVVIKQLKAALPSEALEDTGLKDGEG